jgi:hypothetical protein
MSPKRTSQIAAALTLAIAAIGISTTSSFAFSSEAQQLCTGDAFRLCASEIPDISRVSACMYRNRSQVSPGCRAIMERENSAHHTVHRRSRRAAAD